LPPEPADAPGVAHLSRHSRPVVAGSRRGRETAVYQAAFADADISAVANGVLGQTLNLPFAIDPGVTGKLSFKTDRPLTREGLLRAFEAALALDEVAMVRRDAGFFLTPRAKAKTAAQIRRVASSHATVEPGFQLLSVPVAFANPTDVAKAVEAAGGADLVVHADDQTGVLVLAGSSGELTEALKTVALFDRSGLAAGRSRTVELRRASPVSVAADLTTVLHATGVSGVNVAPLTRLDAILITARSEEVLSEAAAWAERLDVPSHEESYTLWVYHPQNIPAESLGATLSQILSEGGGEAHSDAAPAENAALSAPPNAPPLPPPSEMSGGRSGGASSGVKISVNKDTNTLVVMAPQSRWTVIKGMLDQLDTPAAQVLIEASVLEVTLGREFKTGVEWTFVGAGGALTITNSQDPQGVVAPQFPGLGISYFDNSVKAVINALASKTHVQVVSAPKLIALDNQPATLDVGDQVPITNQTAQSVGAPGAPIVANTDYKDTGIILKIKPRVNGPDTVTLDFSQEVSSVVPTTSSTINSPTIQQRRFQTQMKLHDGQTVAIGGLISMGRTYDDQGVPLLKDIPAFGRLFKSADNNNTRTEIIVLINAHIIRSREEAQQATDRLEPEMPGLQSHGMLPPK
jgi:general secretion pathway protein D